MCFAADAVYRVDGRIELDGWSGTIDGRGATFRRYTASTSQGEHFRIVQGRNVVIENLDIRGPATLSDIQNRTYGGSDRQDQHAFSVESTVGFTLRNATLTGIWGDGVNVRARNGGGIDNPSSKVLISGVTMDVIGRNGIGIISVAGLPVRSVKINHAALHAIDGEPNRSTDVLANIVIESSDLRNFDAGHTPSGPGWAVVLTPGYANVLPTNIVIRNNTMDKPRVRVDGYDSSHLARNVSVTGNRPSVAGSAVFQHVQGLTFSDNGLMTADKTDVS